MQRYKGKTVLITGGTGFVGGRLAERLVLEEGANVKVLGRDWSKAVWISRYPVDLILGDITCHDSVREAMQNCDLVFHCASGLGPNLSYRNTNVLGTKNILDCAINESVERVVYVSSIAVHGPNFQENSDEKAPFIVTDNDYGNSKIETEKLIWKYWNENKLPLTVIRPTFVWGPRSALFTVRQILEMKNGSFAWIDNGDGSCHSVYIDNLVDALLLAGIKHEAIGEAFIVSDESNITWQEFFGYYARMLKIIKLPSLNSRLILIRLATQIRGYIDRLLVKLSPNPAPIWRKIIRRIAYILQSWLRRNRICNYWDLQKYSRKGSLNIAKSKQLLGYEPRFSVESGMQETEIWLKDQLGLQMGLSNFYEKFNR